MPKVRNTLPLGSGSAGTAQKALSGRARQLEQQEAAALGRSASSPTRAAPPQPKSPISFTTGARTQTAKQLAQRDALLRKHRSK